MHAQCMWAFSGVWEWTGSDWDPQCVSNEAVFVWTNPESVADVMSRLLLLYRLRPSTQCSHMFLVVWTSRPDNLLLLLHKHQLHNMYTQHFTEFMSETFSLSCNDTQTMKLLSDVRPTNGQSEPVVCESQDSNFRHRIHTMIQRTHGSVYVMWLLFPVTYSFKDLLSSVGQYQVTRRWHHY